MEEVSAEVKAQRAAAKQRLQGLLDQLTIYQQVMNEPLDGWDKNTAAGAVIRRREAEDQVKMLSDGYKALISNSVIKVFVTGERANEFAERAAKEGAVVVDGHGMYKSFAKAVMPSIDLKSPQFTSAQIILLTQVMQRYMQEKKIHVLQMPKLSANDMDVPCVDEKVLEATIAKAISNTNGDDLLAFDLTETILDKALEQKVASTAMPVLITGLSLTETQSLSSKLFGSQPTISIEATANSTDEELIKDLNGKILSVFNSKK